MIDFAEEGKGYWYARNFKKVGIQPIMVIACTASGGNVDSYCPIHMNNIIYKEGFERN